MLSQMFGRWPIDEFRALDAKEQKDFWASSVACHDKHSLKKLVEDKLVRRFIESKLVSHKGPYKPLSVWEKKDTIRSPSSKGASIGNAQSLEIRTSSGCCLTASRSERT